MSRFFVRGGRDARRWLLTAAAVVAAVVLITHLQRAGAQPPPGQMGLKRPFSPVIEEIWRALHSDDVIQQLRKEGVGEDELNRLRGEFDRANDEMRKSWDNYRRVTGFSPNYNRNQQRGDPVPVPPAGRLGVTVEKVGEPLAEHLNLPKGQGLLVRTVTPNTAAAKLGLQPNDILLRLDGKAITADPAAFRQQVQGLKGNAGVDVQVMRKGKTETLRNLRLP
jgi:S1-C subfamily serine protease